jgi:hypothetical protein
MQQRVNSKAHVNQVDSGINRQRGFAWNPFCVKCAMR